LWVAEIVWKEADFCFFLVPPVSAAIGRNVGYISIFAGDNILLSHP